MPLRRYIFDILMALILLPPTMMGCHSQTRQQPIASRDEPNVPEGRLPLQDIAIAVSMPNSNQRIEIADVYQMNDSLWVVSQVYYGQFHEKHEETISDAIKLRLPKLPVRHIVVDSLGEHLNRPIYCEFCRGRKQLNEELKKGTLWYHRPAGNIWYRDFNTDLKQQQNAEGILQDLEIRANAPSTGYRFEIVAVYQDTDTLWAVVEMVDWPEAMSIKEISANLRLRLPKLPVRYVLVNKRHDAKRRGSWKPKGFHFEDTIQTFEKDRKLRVLFQRNNSDRARAKAIKVANAAIRTPTDPDTSREVSHQVDRLTDNDAATRRNAAFKIGHLGKAAVNAVPALTRALKDEDSSVRQFAAYALGRIGPVAKDALPALELMAKKDKADVRFAAQDAIRKIKPGIR